MNTKLIVALVIVGVLAVTVVGLASAQIATSNTNASSNGVSNNGLFGWMGRCFGFRGNTNYGIQTPAYSSLPANVTVTNLYTNQTATYQAFYRYGPCMRGFFP